MTPRTGWVRGFLLAVGVGWILLACAGVLYARQKNIPLSVAGPLIAAFLVEYVFYLVPGFEKLRNWLSDRIPPRKLALGLALSGLLPYLIYSLSLGEFRAA